MSGFAALFNREQAPIAAPLLQRMGQAMTPQGPDGLSVWIGERVGLVCALLKTTHEAQDEQQPWSADGSVYLVGNVRLDNRTQLVEALYGSGGRCVRLDQPDIVLLHDAYQLWGRDCVYHLQGDFAFIAWDQTQQHLFAARDPWGVRPLYYAQVQGGFVFSNALNTVRMHPDISPRLNETTIADFLLFDFNPNPASTFFTDVQRLPPAHSLTCNQNGLSLHRYWQLPLAEPIRYPQRQQYVEHFQELLDRAVQSRLRCDRASILLSGGLDSTAIAATARPLLPKDQLHAITLIYERLIPDREGDYASLVAHHLQIPQHFIALDDYGLYDRGDDPRLLRPEPIANPFLASQVDYLHRAAQLGRVFLTGQGGDPALLPSGVYLEQQVRSGRWFDLVAAIWAYTQWHHRLPRIGLRTTLRRWLGRSTTARYPFPPWLNPNWVQKLKLEQRWSSGFDQSEISLPKDFPRPEAYLSLSSPFWPALLENFDSGVTQMPLEGRYPYFDTNLLVYLLSIPPIPWCIEKHLLRVAMDGKLPPEICQRPKTTLVGNPFYLLAQRPLPHSWVTRSLPPQLADFFQITHLPPLGEPNQTAIEVWLNLRLYSLVQWFNQVFPD